MSTICKNCNNIVEQKFCGVCSQKASTGRLKVGTVLHEFWHNFTHTDRSFLSLISLMIRQPGMVIRDYLEGKRKKYFNPFTFYVIVTGLLILITGKVFHYEDELYKFNNEFGQYLAANYNFILLASMPFIAGLLWLIFRNKKYNYAEWLVFLVFSFGIINALQIVVQLLYLLIIRYHAVLLVYTESASYLFLFYILIRFIQPRKFWGWVQCILATLVIFAFVEFGAKAAALVYGGVSLEKIFHMQK